MFGRISESWLETDICVYVCVCVLTKRCVYLCVFMNCVYVCVHLCACCVHMCACLCVSVYEWMGECMVGTMIKQTSYILVKSLCLDG